MPSIPSNLNCLLQDPGLSNRHPEVILFITVLPKVTFHYVLVSLLIVVYFPLKYQVTENRDRDIFSALFLAPKTGMMLSKYLPSVNQSRWLGRVEKVCSVGGQENLSLNPDLQNSCLILSRIFKFSGPQCFHLLKEHLP